MESNAKNGGTTGALWEYEAPQFCDFSDNQTFEPNPEVDSFFFTDHESKENVSSDDSSGSTDLFQTPMTINSDSKNIDSNESEIEPKDLDATPRRSTFCASISKYPLRETPLRQLYVNGGTPMQESRPSKVFGSRRSKHFGSLANQSKTIETPKLAPQLSSSELSTCGETSTAQTPSKRITFDVTDHVIEQVKALDINRGNEDPYPVEEKKEVEEKKVESVSESESVSENVTEKSIQSIEIAPKQQSNGNVSYDLISEDDDDNDEEDEKEFDKSKSINQTVCVQKQECDEQQSEISSSAAIEPQTNEEIDEDAAEFHPIADADLTEESLEPSISAADINTSRQSYVVSSPSIRVVHFDERSFIGKNDDDKPQEEEGENQQKITNTTPVGQVEESNRKKIQMRHKTPVPRITSTTTTSIKNTTNTNTSTTSKNITGARKLFDRAARQKKYIKRFSKNRTLQDGELSGDQAKVDAVSSQLPSNNIKSAMAKPKKRVTIAANISTKTMNNGAGGGGTIVKAKRNLSLKPSTNRTSIFSSSAATSKQNEAKNSPYLGLAVLNYKYMNSFRSIVPINRTNGGNSKTIAKPKLTVPRAPKLMTAARHDARKYHQSLSSSSSGGRNQKNENATVFRQEKIKSNEKLISATKPKTIIGPDGKLVPKKSATTKATTPHFASDARIKIWHQKHDNVDGGDGSGATAAAAASSQSHFKARPMPNFKKLQANEDKRKKEAFQKCRATFRTVSTISTASAASEPK